jgi:protein-S-isoprenylcysteine O-methyltransferase Ste14
VPTIRATDWEFRNRAWLFGALFGLAFFLYSVDPKNATDALANRLSAASGANAETIARLLLLLAAAFTTAAALMRSWGSAYLHKDIVYASQVKSASLVAGGPYRYVRNPLYFGNELMAIGIGALASRLGFFFLVLGMTIFNYRLVLREESDLAAARGRAYADYLRGVPRLFPCLWPRIPRSEQQPDWPGGLRAESWCWCLPLGIITFVFTFNLGLMWAVMIVAYLASWPLVKFTLK